ncbi:MAG: TetR/AcrR family transcriptional regulator [Ktedonobacterales bacterium]
MTGTEHTEQTEQPERPTRREQQAEQRRAQLIDTALDLFAEKGVESTTIKDIATHADVAQGLVYHYFDSKDALFMAVIERHGPIKPARELMTQVYGHPASEKLPEIAHAMYRLASEREKLLRIVLREALTRPEMRQVLLLVRGQMLAIVGGYLQSRIAAGELRPHATDVTLQTMALSILSLVLLGLPPDPYIDDLVETVLHGISAEPAHQE